MNLQNFKSEFSFLPALFVPRYQHRLYKSYVYTDPVREIMCERSSASVVERIFALQLDERAVKNTLIQHWNLKILPDGAVFLMCADLSGDILYYEYGYPTDLPSGDLSFTLNRNILDIRKKEKLI